MKRREFVRHAAAAGTVLAVGPAWTTGCRSRSRQAGSVRLDFDPDWQFLLGDAEGAELSGFDAAAWSGASLPHTARIESLVTGEPGSATFQAISLSASRLAGTPDASATPVEMFVVNKGVRARLRLDEEASQFGLPDPLGADPSS